MTQLVGREAELSSLEQLLSDPDCRLLTLVGPGGIGKSRLGIEAACNVWPRFADCVFFAPMAATSAPEFMVQTIAQAVGLNFAGPAEPRVQLVNHLGNQWDIALATGNIGLVAQTVGEYEEAEQCWQTALAIERRLGNQRMVAAALHFSGILKRTVGAFAEAQACFRESLQLCEPLGERWIHCGPQPAWPGHKRTWRSGRGGSPA